MELTLDQALQKGIEAHKAGQVQEADRYYTAILNANAKHPDANHNMGVLAVGVGKVQEALPFFKAALDANPKIDQFWLSYIDTLIKLDRLADAKAVFDQAKSKGVTSDGFDRIEIKLANISQIEGDQTDEEIIGVAINLRETGKYNKAIDLLLQQIKRSPTNPNMLSVLSHCYILNDNLEQAKIYLYEAKDINPNIASIGWNETRLLLKQKKVTEALVVAEKTNKLFPDDIEGMSVFGSCLRANGRFDESLKYLDKAIKIDPNYAEALINRGLIYLHKKYKANALTDLEKAYHIKPYIKQIWHLILNLKIEVKEYEDTISLAEEMVKLDPVDEKAFAAIATCYQQLKNYDQTVVFYKKVLSLRPDYPEVYNNMGVALKDQGKLEDAIEAYNKALSIKPYYAEAYTNMGNALNDQGNLEDAIEAYNKALSIKPDNAEAYTNLGVALKDQGKLEDAIEAYNKALSIKPDYAEAIVNASSLKNQISDTELINKVFERKLGTHDVELIKLPKFQIYQALRAFILSDQKLVCKYLNSYRGCTSSSIDQMNSRDQIFCSAYYNFLQKLIETPFKNEAPVADEKTIFHIGESHCLSYAHKKIKLQDANYTIAPRITFGAKAYHFSIEKNSAYKAITKANFDSLPDSSTVFISFGEIDCRPNEGFIPAAKKHKKPIEDLVSNTVEGYIDWFVEQNQTKNHRLFFLNVPAPIYNETVSRQLNKEVAETVKLFNESFCHQLANREFNLIDVYKFTVGNNGFSNRSFHIDNHHLSSYAIPEIEQQIKN